MNALGELSSFAVIYEPISSRCGAVTPEPPPNKLPSLLASFELVPSVITKVTGLVSPTSIFDGRLKPLIPALTLPSRYR